MTDNFSLLSLDLRRPGKIKGVTTMKSNAIIWANLLGTWHDLEKEDSDCTMGIKGQKPSTWWDENTDLWAPFSRDLVCISFQGDTYWVSTFQIEAQIEAVGW